MHEAPNIPPLAGSARSELLSATATAPAPSSQMLAEGEAPRAARFGRGGSTEPLAGKIGVVARIMGVSPSTVRRRLTDDPEFPKPFRLSTEGDLLWVLAEVRTYLELKAGRPLAAKAA